MFEHKLKQRIPSVHGEVMVYRLSEADRMKARHNTKHPSGLTRSETIRRVASGESLSQIERSKGMKPNEIYHWAKKWDINGIHKDEAIALIIEENIQAIEEEIKEAKELIQESQPVSVAVHNETKKVGLPMKVANALERAKAMQWGDNEILIITAQSAWKTVTDDATIHQLNGFMELIKLSRAMIEGYEIARTPEEILEEAYRSTAMVPDHINRKQAFQQGMKFALETMGHRFEWIS